MDFNMKKLASDAGIFFTRAVQFTEEKFGQAEKTELDAHFENLLARADSTKNWTEKILRQTEVLLQPNPSARVEEFLYEKLDRKVPSRVTNGELLAQYMAEAASELGPTTPYDRVWLCPPGWSAVVQSQLTANSASPGSSHPPTSAS
uniref:SH3 domain containing GRB2 like, endophilin B2 n=1 Tax=Cebus imitator TaxID=2715852 RepID=A0A2K5QA92_CEBIM